jgi:hypothetical protein
MPKYLPADRAVTELATSILIEFDSHAPTVAAGVKIEYVFALPDLDEDSGEPKNAAIRHQGQKALGLCRKMNPKDRALRGFEVQILLDKEWWDNHDEEEQRALLDHELHHVAVVEGKKADDGRPIIKLRKHDFQFGWFAVIAHRHGKYSQERQQASQMVEMAGQYLFPQFCEQIECTPKRKSSKALAEKVGEE